MNKALSTQRNITQTSKQTNWWSFDESLAGCLKTFLTLSMSKYFSFNTFSPGRVVQSGRCLVTDASLTADPGVVSLIPAWSHTFVEMNHEIIPMVILLPFAESYKKRCCQLQAEICARSTGKLLVQTCPGKVWLGELTVQP